MAKRQPRGSGGGGFDERVQDQQQRQQPSAADHLRVALGAAHETEEMGTETLAELERQGEQLGRVQRKLDATEAHADRSNWILKGMKSLFSFRGKEPPKPKEVVAEREAARAAKGGAGKAGKGSSGGSAERGSDEQGVDGDSPNVAGKQQQPRATKKAARNEEDALLDALSESMSRVKVVATGIGDEMDRQDAVLDGIATSAERVDDKVKKATRDARKLAR